MALALGLFDSIILRLLKLLPPFIKLFLPKNSPFDERFQWVCPQTKRVCWVHLYRPPKKQDGKPNDLTPVHINLQGAGFVMPNHGSDAQFCRLLADRAQCTVLDFDYPKAPEAPWPVPQETISRFVDWAVAESNAKGWDATRLSISGFSSGGLLALITASSKPRTFTSVSVFYPSTNFSIRPRDKPAKSQSKGSTGSEIPNWLRSLFYRAYLPKGTDLKDPLVSPYFAEPTDYPNKITIVTCSGDKLSTEAIALGEKLSAAGLDVVQYSAVGQGHGWDKVAGARKEGTEPNRLRKESYDLVVSRIAEGYAQAN